nr:ensconsin-like [Pogona vitticeps]
MGGCCSGSVAPEVLKQEEEFPPLSAEKEQLKLQNGEKEEQVSRLLQAVQELKAQVSRLSAEKEQQKQQNQEKEEEMSRLLQELKREVSHLQQQNQEKDEQISHLQHKVQKLEEQASRLSAENQQVKQQNQERDEQISHLQHKVQKLEEQVSPLQQEVQELKKSPGASGAQQTTRWISPFGGPTLPVKVQIRITGKTGGSEEKFLNCVSEHLSHKGVSLKVEKFKETSKDPLLLFCPIASRMGADIENALEGLSGEQKVLLVVMHFVQKDNPGTPADAEHQVTHPAVVGTVHTRYTLKDGFYPCEMNEAAVADVAAALKALAEDQ